MNIFNAMDISASALSAQTIRMNTVSSNLANAETTRTDQGTPYYRKSVVLRPKNEFSAQLEANLQDKGVAGVEVTNIISNPNAVKKVFDPGNPDANNNGYVTMPDINVLTEMTDLMSASRAYEANVTGIKATQRMAVKALEIGG